MADQETLGEERNGFDPLAHGLWKRFVDNGCVVHGAWLRACAEGSFVGTCRICCDYLAPRHPHEARAGRYDYEYQCRNVQCGQIYNAPGGRMFVRSSRSSERGSGGTYGT
jgi:hypothetical protein